MVQYEIILVTLPLSSKALKAMTRSKMHLYCVEISAELSMLTSEPRPIHSCNTTWYLKRGKQLNMQMKN